MEKADMHTAASHEIDNSKHLTHKQRNAIVTVMQGAPLLAPVEVWLAAFMKGGMALLVSLHECR